MKSTLATIFLFIIALGTLASLGIDHRQDRRLDALQVQMNSLSNRPAFILKDATLRDRAVENLILARLDSLEARVDILEPDLIRFIIQRNPKTGRIEMTSEMSK